MDPNQTGPRVPIADQTLERSDNHVSRYRPDENSAAETEPAKHAEESRAKHAEGGRAKPGAGEAEQFVQLLTTFQGQLFAYIYTLTANPEQARDILQETNRQLWRSANKFDHSREFLPWAKTFAFNQIRTDRKRRKRDRLVFHQQQTLNQLSDQIARQPSQPPTAAITALEECLKQLPEKHRQLVTNVYEHERSLAEIAASTQRRENTVAVTLHRIRQALSNCIRAKVKSS